MHLGVRLRAELTQISPFNPSVLFMMLQPICSEKGAIQTCTQERLLLWVFLSQSYCG